VHFMFEFIGVDCDDDDFGGRDLVEATEERVADTQPPKGAWDVEEFPVSLKRYPDTNRFTPCPGPQLEN
jgi:hypothetical protein